MKTLMVTGGYGFIGSNFILRNIDKYRIVNVDTFTYASNRENLDEIENHPNHEPVVIDINSLNYRDLRRYDIDAIIHFAAESHVDNSIDDPFPFVRSNVNGTVNLLNSVLQLEKNSGRKIEFIHVSTDEVFGSLELDDPNVFTEETPYNPHSPYSASKASSDHFVRAFHTTYGLDVKITNCTNNYGPRQHREKLIPTIIKNALEGNAIPIYGDGKYSRDWIHVDDHCDGILAVLNKGKTGETYCIGGGNEIDNISIAKIICKHLDEIVPFRVPYADQILFVTDRPGHDRRYAISIDKIKRELGWEPKIGFEDGLKDVVKWYAKLFK